ncbi:MAG: Mor transcription activator family protein [Gammaproteobacteria bacterium]|nr:Mor transcription activator family protein [Gammaproteobacteria bacterium]
MSIMQQQHKSLNSDGLPELMGEAIGSTTAQWPETMRDMVEMFTRHVMKIRPLSEAKARQEAKGLVLELSHHFGGQQVYIARDEKLRLAIRNYCMLKEFDGSNVVGLARRYRLSVPSIYDILKKEKQRQAQRRGKNRA